MRKKHYIFTDLDGTFYNMESEIHPDLERDIKYAQDKGIEIVICTGNGAFEKILYLAKKYNIRYIISSNGSWIYDNFDKKTIYAKYIDFDQVQQIINYSNNLNSIIGMWDDKRIYINRDIESKIKRIKQFMGDVEIVSTSELKNGVFTITKEGNVNNIDLLENYVTKIGLTVARIRDDFLEITRKDSNKGEGIKRFAKVLHIDLENTMGIGDSKNDVSMFKIVKHSYAMANANDNIKKEAMHHTASVNQNGLGFAIIDYIHRNNLDK